MIYSNFITPASHAISNLFCGIANFRKSSYLHNIKHPHDFMFKITQPNSISAQREKKQPTNISVSIHPMECNGIFHRLIRVSAVSSVFQLNRSDWIQNEQERKMKTSNWMRNNEIYGANATHSWLVGNTHRFYFAGFLLVAFFLHIMWVSVGLFSRLHEQCRRSDVLQLAHTRARSGHSRWMWVWVLFLPYIGVSIHGARHTALYAIFILFQIGVFISLKQMNDF